MKIRIVQMVMVLLASLLFSCGSGRQQANEESEEPVDTTAQVGHMSYVDLKDPLEEDLVTEGEKIYASKCFKCHHLNSTRLVGPGWAGITNRRKPTWIMNMILNVNIMVETDSIAHQLRDSLKTQMPMQGLTVSQARGVLEFMRKNDLDKLGEKDQGRSE